MTVISSEGIEFKRQSEVPGKMHGAWCLCPAWMGWMPWLVDGDEVLQVQRETMVKNSVSHRHLTSLKGL